MNLLTISPGLAGKIVKKLPGLGTNQIAGFGGFRPLASSEKINIDIYIRNFWLEISEKSLEHKPVTKRHLKFSFEIVLKFQK